MSVKTDSSGNRFVELEFEVPGTPEQVWRAIATGPGISSWFVPTEVEEREGGALLFHLGPGMDSPGIVTGWEPPRRFTYEERDWSPNAPPLATELLVEARSGGTCVVRMVHSLFTSSEEWDDQMEGFEAGWPPFLDILRLVLTHYTDQPCASFRLMGPVAGSEPEAWEALKSALGEPRQTPPFAGTIERTGREKSPHEILFRLDEPAPGIALMGVYSWGGQVHASLSFYLFGDQAYAAAARDEPLGQAWMNETFAATVVDEPS